VVISSRVGVVVDSLEAATYKLFQSVPDFRSATVNQYGDSTLWVAAISSTADGNLRESTFPISNGVLHSYADVEV